MSIQKFAAERFLSTTSIFRFTQKLGFSGYAEFINSLLVTTHKRPEDILPMALMAPGYHEGYLKNTIETIRVMSEQEIDKVMALLAHSPSIYILTDDRNTVLYTGVTGDLKARVHQHREAGLL